ncbi:MAG TPA: AMP-binding protein, partial [Bryobacteraceae bacterium]|nr:AMP-binding protein [Bryobacteraceae bacterium]
MPSMLASGIRQLARLLFRVLYRVRIRGTVEPHERLLLVSNHQSLLDGVLLGAFLPVKPVWVLHTSIVRHWWVRIPMRFQPHLVVDSSNPMTMKAVIELLESGRPVLIFPEGRVTVTGSMMKIYDGPAYAAARASATVVPVTIDGAVYTLFSRMSGDFPRRWFPRITITIHPPRKIEKPDLPTARKRRRIEAEDLRRIMQESQFEAREPTTLWPGFLDAASLYGPRRRILEDTRAPYVELPYRAIMKGALALGRIVSRLTSEGEFTGILLPNVSTTVSLIFGLYAFRRVPTMLNYSSGADAIRHACRSAGLKLVITSRAFVEKARLGETVARLEGIRVVYLEDLRSTFTLTDKLWLVLYAMHFPRRVGRPSKPEDPAVVLFTSGSEGRPKGVVLSHDAILANVAQARSIIEFAPKDRFMSALPLFHAFGLTIGVFLPLFGGSHIFLYVSPLHYRVIPELIYDRDCTVLFASSTFLGNYAKHANVFDFRSLRIVVAGAEKLADEVRQLYIEKFGIRILEGYGVTETAPVLSVNTPHASRTGSVGELFPGCQCRIEPVPGIESAGVLHVKGPNVMLGYLSETEPGKIIPVRSIFGEGWYNTGDVASVDERGVLTIHGRIKRFAKVAGEMVSLELVERIAAAASPDRNHAAVAVPESGRGETVLLLTEDGQLRREALQQTARRMGAPELAIPRRIVQIPEIPVLGSGKKDYVAINAIGHDLVRQAIAGD